MLHVYDIFLLHWWEVYELKKNCERMLYNIQYKVQQSTYSVVVEYSEQLQKIFHTDVEIGILNFLTASS